jgi:hypothetical protein
MTKFGMDAISMSTTLESNKSLMRLQWYVHEVWHKHGTPELAGVSSFLDR